MSLVHHWNKLGLCVLSALLLAGRADAATSYAQMTHELQSDAERSPFIQVTSIGKSASGARTIWLVRIGVPLLPHENPRRILALCRQHGDEPAGTEAVLRVARQVAQHGLSAWPGGRQAVLYAVPMVNPDGADLGTRVNGSGADLNRDWGVFHQPETRAVYAAYKAIRPQLVLDLHSWDTTDPFRKMCLEGPRAGLASRLESALTDFQARAVDASPLQERIAATGYTPGADPTLCHRFFWTVRHTPALLFETDAGSNTPALLALRVRAAYGFLTWALSDAAHPHACWTQFATAAPDAQDTLFERASETSQRTAKAVTTRLRVPWQAWGSIVCWGLVVFLRYGRVPGTGTLRCRTARRTETRAPWKVRLRAMRILAQRRIRTQHDDRRPYFRFAQPDQRRRDAGGSDLRRSDPARHLYHQIH